MGSSTSSKALCRPQARPYRPRSSACTALVLLQIRSRGHTRLTRSLKSTPGSHALAVQSIAGLGWSDQQATSAPSQQLLCSPYPADQHELSKPRLQRLRRRGLCRRSFPGGPHLHGTPHRPAWSLKTVIELFLQGFLTLTVDHGHAELRAGGGVPHD